MRKAEVSLGQQIADPILRKHHFQGRGLGARTVEALVTCDIDWPERLLFMAEDELKAIPGVGKASMQEIETYRARFIR